MSDDFNEWMSGAGEERDPEDFFSLVTILRDRKLRIIAHLEDAEGNRIDLKEVATDLLAYIEKHMQSPTSTPVNDQIFPLLSQSMVSVVPRTAGISVADFIFSAGVLRNTMIRYGLASFLLAQYIQQHKLKIVTEEEPLTQHEIDEYMRKSEEAENKLRRVLRGDSDLED